MTKTKLISKPIPISGELSLEDLMEIRRDHKKANVVILREASGKYPVREHPADSIRYFECINGTVQFGIKPKEQVDQKY